MPAVPLEIGFQSSNFAVLFAYGIYFRLQKELGLLEGDGLDLGLLFKLYILLRQLSELEILKLLLRM